MSASFWKQWLHRKTPKVPKGLFVWSDESWGICAYCDRKAERDSARTLCPVWKCGCGAVGSGTSFVPDLDEVMDTLLSFINIPGTVSEPAAPLEGSEILSLQPFDIRKSMSGLEEILHRHGFEMKAGTFTGREVSFPDQKKSRPITIHTIWIRPVRTP